MATYSRTLMYRNIVTLLFYHSYLVLQGSTPTKRTGPSDAVEGTHYAYTEVTGIPADQAARLTTYGTQLRGKRLFNYSFVWFSLIFVVFLNLHFCTIFLFIKLYKIKIIFGQSLSRSITCLLSLDGCTALVFGLFSRLSLQTIQNFVEYASFFTNHDTNINPRGSG